MKTVHYYVLRIRDKDGAHAKWSEAPSMSEVAELLTEFSKILGNRQRVRFRSIEQGSMVAVAEVDSSVSDGIVARVVGADHWDPYVRGIKRFPSEVTAMHRLNKMMERHHLTGSIGYTDNLETQDITPLLELGQRGEWEYKPIVQPGALDGRVIRVGHSGSTPTVPVHLEPRAGPLYLCRASRDLADAMGSHLNGPYLRVHGEGEWSKVYGRSWRVRKFMIQRFELLLFPSDFEQSLRRLRNSDLAKKLSVMEDPQGYLSSLREGGSD